MDMVTIGQRIKAAREQAHITQDALARQIGFTPHHVSAIERGLKTPKLETFVAIAKAVGVSADWLLQEELGASVDILASNAASAMRKLPADTQVKLLKAIRAFSDE